MNLFFSYGVLQFDKTQIDTFGRLLNRTVDIVKGYKLDNIKIQNPEIITLMDNDFHPVAKSTNNLNDEITGTVFELSDEDMAKIETYTQEYTSLTKTEVTLGSGKKSWMYVSK